MVCSDNYMACGIQAENLCLICISIAGWKGALIQSRCTLMFTLVRSLPRHKRISPRTATVVYLMAGCCAFTLSQLLVVEQMNLAISLRHVPLCATQIMIEACLSRTPHVPFLCNIEYMHALSGQWACSTSDLGVAEHTAVTMYEVDSSSYATSAQVNYKFACMCGLPGGRAARVY